MNPHELLCIRLLLERCESTAQEMGFSSRVDANVVVLGLKPVDCRQRNTQDPVARRHCNTVGAAAAAFYFVQQGGELFSSSLDVACLDTSARRFHRRPE